MRARAARRAALRQRRRGGRAVLGQCASPPPPSRLAQRRPSCLPATRSGRVCRSCSVLPRRRWRRPQRRRPLLAPPPAVGRPAWERVDENDCHRRPRGGYPRGRRGGVVAAAAGASGCRALTGSGTAAHTRTRGTSPMAPPLSPAAHRAAAPVRGPAALPTTPASGGTAAAQSSWGRGWRRRGSFLQLQPQRWAPPPPPSPPPAPVPSPAHSDSQASPPQRAAHRRCVNSVSGRARRASPRPPSATPPPVGRPFFVGVGLPTSTPATPSPASHKYWKGG